MSISKAETGTVPVLTLSANVGRIARFRDRAALFVMLTGAVFNVLALVGIMPAIASIAGHFAERATDGTVMTVLGYKFGVELSTQLMITLLNIGIMVAGPLLGLVAERLGYMRLLPIALGVYAVAGSAGLYLDDPKSLLLSRLVIGLAAASISIACYALIGQRFQGEDRSRMLGYQSAIIMVFGLLGLFGGGWIADLGGWRAPFAMYLLAVPMLLVALVAAQPAERHPNQVEKAPGLSVLKPLWPLYLMLIPFNLAAYMTSVHLPFVLTGDGIMKASTQGNIMASSFVMNIVTSLFYGRIAARFSRRWIFVILMGLFATSDMIIGFSHDWVGSMVGCWVAGLGGGLMTPFFVNIILNRAPEAARARAIGLYYTMMYVGDFANPFFITPLRQQVGNHWIFALVGFGLFAVVILQALVRWTPVGPDVKMARTAG